MTLATHPSTRRIARLAACVTALALAACTTADPPAARSAPAVSDRSAGAQISRQQLEDFADLFYKQKKVRAAFEAHVVENYVQHAAGVGQGREAAISGLEKFFSRPGLTIEPIRVLVDGNMATILLKASLPDGSTAFVMDLFRADKGKLVEHWDLKQPVPKDKESALFAGLSAQR